MADPGMQHLDQASMAWNTVASYTSYEEAQRAVDRLADMRFPVENLEIVGSNLRLVERVTGRLTKARAAAAGAVGGAWFRLNLIARGGNSAQVRSTPQQAGMLGDQSTDQRPPT